MKMSYIKTMSIEIKDNTDEFLEAFSEAKARALKKIGLAAEGYAKKETPVDTGRLRNSITHAEDEKFTYIGTNVEYGPYVELGSSHNTAHHMLQRAATEHEDEYERLVKDSLENA